MKRIFICVMALLLTTGCAVYGKPMPIESVTTEEFDMATAAEMIRELEAPIVELLKKDKLSRAEFETLKNAHEIFGAESQDISVLYTFFDIAHLEDEARQELELLDNPPRYPTIFDDGIEITRAYIETTVYKPDAPTPAPEVTFARMFLHIVEEYTGGDDGILKGFTRDYVFRADANGEWRLEHIGGNINILSESGG